MTQPARTAGVKPQSRSQGGLLDRTMPLRDAAQRLLLLQYEIATEQRQAVLTASSPEALHDLRVSLRRFRAVLRFLRGSLKDTESRRMELRLAEMLDRLSPYRDREVRLRFLQAGPGRDPKLQPPPRRLTALLTGETTRRLFVEMGHLAHVSIPALTGPRHQRGFTPYAARRLKRALSRLLDRGALPEAATPEQSHRRRKQIRRLRYYAEICEPVLGSRVTALRHLLKELADSLGDVHDVNMFLAHAKRTGSRVGTGLGSRLQRNRASAVLRYARQWDRFAAPAYSHRIIGYLEGMEQQQ
jgi:CHAD domain-containing protein